jgi:hypothetical protein
LIREIGAMPIDYQHDDFTRVLPAGLSFSRSDAESPYSDCVRSEPNFVERRSPVE